MDKAKSAISGFMHKAGHHDTTVHESVAPAVTQETVKPVLKEEVTTAVDKEVHQDHYHQTVQPVRAKEVLPETHTHNLAAVQHKEVDHRDHDRVQRELAQQQAQFKDTRIVADTARTQTAAPVVGGEHIHHHIHETIQPVIHKETIQPNVVHTTVPIHEVHHNKAQHHQTSELPAVSLEEFQSRGGVLGGREERYDGFEGEPKHIGGTLSNLNPTKHDSTHQGTREGTGHLPNTSSRTAGTSAGSGLTGTHGTHDPTGERKIGTGTGAGLGNTTSHNNPAKPSLMQKLNPTVDSDGDGKKGFMK